MVELQRTISPVDGTLLVERPLATDGELDAALDAAVAAFRSWRGLSLGERTRRVGAFVQAVMAGAEDAARELTLQMGRPARDAPGELAGFAERAGTMSRLAEAALRPRDPGPKEGFRRAIVHEP
ncbi:MAG: aldehyde dehydrogenase family protein, partial [Myxococcota bacterium]